MKKRFTVMLEENTIKLVKAIYNYQTPVSIREELEEHIKQYAINTLSYHQAKELTKVLKK